MRLFIAIEPNIKVRGYLENLQEKLGSPDAKLTIAKGHHLTLKFLGEVSDKEAEEIKSALSKIKFYAFELETSDIGFFPDAKNPRVIWIGTEPKDKINRLQKDIDDAVERYGFLKDNKFHPHITLARVKYVKEMKYFERIKQLNKEKIPFCVDSFILYKSDLLPEGPKYTKLFEKKAEE
jgi:RNA 2',3'-cyclic 3'-phosphodiesterase